MHLVRAALRYVNTEDGKPVARDLKKIYQAATPSKRIRADDFAQVWEEKYPTIVKMWRAKWTDIVTLFDFPAPDPQGHRRDQRNRIRQQRDRRGFTRNRKIYPNEESALKITFMAIHEASKKWTMPIRNWKAAA